MLNLLRDCSKPTPNQTKMAGAVQCSSNVQKKLFTEGFMNLIKWFPEAWIERTMNSLGHNLVECCSTANFSDRCPDQLSVVPSLTIVHPSQGAKPVLMDIGHICQLFGRYPDTRFCSHIWLKAIIIEIIF